jgi:uncharacterized protein YxeA
MAQALNLYRQFTQSKKYIMKKTISGIAIVLLFGTQVNAQTDTSGRMNPTTTQNGVKQQSTTFDYYPESNVYYNPIARSYWYYDNNSSKWMSGQAIPSDYRYNNNAWNSKGQKTTIPFNGTNIWQDNSTHLKNFGNKPATNQVGNQPMNNQPINNKPVNNQ